MILGVDTARIRARINRTVKLGLGLMHCIDLNQEGIAPL